MATEDNEFFIDQDIADIFNDVCISQEMLRSSKSLQEFLERVIERMNKKNIAQLWSFQALTIRVQSITSLLIQQLCVPRLYDFFGIIPDVITAKNIMIQAFTLLRMTEENGSAAEQLDITEANFYRCNLFINLMSYKQSSLLPFAMTIREYGGAALKSLTTHFLSLAALNQEIKEEIAKVIDNCCEESPEEMQMTGLLLAYFDWLTAHGPSLIAACRQHEIIAAIPPNIRAWCKGENYESAEELLYVYDRKYRSSLGQLAIPWQSYSQRDIQQAKKDLRREQCLVVNKVSYGVVEEEEEEGSMGGGGGWERVRGELGKVLVYLFNLDDPAVFEEEGEEEGGIEDGEGQGEKAATAASSAAMEEYQGQRSWTAMSSLTSLNPSYSQPPSETTSCSQGTGTGTTTTSRLGRSNSQEEEEREPLQLQRRSSLPLLLPLPPPPPPPPVKADMVSPSSTLVPRLLSHNSSIQSNHSDYSCHSHSQGGGQGGGQGQLNWHLLSMLDKDREKDNRAAAAKRKKAVTKEKEKEQQGIGEEKEVKTATALSAASLPSPDKSCLYNSKEEEGTVANPPAPALSPRKGEWQQQQQEEEGEEEHGQSSSSSATAAPYHLRYPHRPQLIYRDLLCLLQALAMMMASRTFAGGDAFILLHDLYGGGEGDGLCFCPLGDRGDKGQVQLNITTKGLQVSLTMHYLLYAATATQGGGGGLTALMGFTCTTTTLLLFTELDQATSSSPSLSMLERARAFFQLLVTRPEAFCHRMVSLLPFLPKPAHSQALLTTSCKKKKQQMKKEQAKPLDNRANRPARSRGDPPPRPLPL